jgi:pimeloyl-ACP methyl ester carboxylesterase
VPALVVIGEQDPDFADPAAEARLASERMAGPVEVLMVPEAGHYPQSQRPDVVTPAVTAFLRRVHPRA